MGSMFCPAGGFQTWVLEALLLDNLQVNALSNSPLCSFKNLSTPIALMLKSVFTDRRLWFVVLLLVLVTAVTRWSLSASEGFHWVIISGYWFTLTLVVLFFRAIWPLVCEWWANQRFIRFDIIALVAIVPIVATWVSHERPGYKVLADEVLLSGTAMGMHYERMSGFPTRATDVQGSFQILNRVLDKRPLVFPFFISTVHDLTGYRPDNVFYLNIGVSAVFLGIIYFVGCRAAKNRWGGLSAMLLFAGLPLLAQQATGGGFELLNLLLIAVFSLLMVEYLEKGGKQRLEALILGALMLASTRYESGMFLVPAAIAAVCVWWRQRQVALSWPVMLSPIFLIPLLLQNRLFEGGSKAWQMGSQQGVTEPFGFQYLGTNMGHALAFFFDFSGYQPSSPVFAVAGLLTLPFFGLWVVRVLRQANQADGRELGWAFVGVSLFSVTAIYLLYFWGKFDDPIISRLSLPVHLLMMVSFVMIGAQFFKSDRAWKIAAGCLTAGILFHSLPVIARQAYRTYYSPGVEMQMRRDFIAKQVDKNLLFVDNDATFWILNKLPASSVMEAMARKDALAYHLKNRSFQEMYVFQSIMVNDKDGTLYVDPVDDLGPDFEIETVWERRVQTLLFARISRIKSIKNGSELIKARRFIEPEKERRTVEELEHARALYLENWVKQLP